MRLSPRYFKTIQITTHAPGLPHLQSSIWVSRNRAPPSLLLFFGKSCQFLLARSTDDTRTSVILATSNSDPEKWFDPVASNRRFWKEWGSTDKLSEIDQNPRRRSQTGPLRTANFRRQDRGTDFQLKNQDFHHSKQSIRSFPHYLLFHICLFVCPNTTIINNHTAGLPRIPPASRSTDRPAGQSNFPPT